ncbi:glycosyltransferase [Acinetobacter sp. ME22]|uniref:glycosyltransferase n=1 Tax=Acinetobacter sp. ME22 TaxID=2904802 RepID=UPI001EDB3777|nr:glycosyltransferase [Acinetobacter sp. ME22]MCG2574276.1 glycosyltransferase [Acinetobacter sp. ME22]
MKKVLVLSKKDSQFCKMLADVISILGDVIYKSEHDFPKVAQLIDLIKSEKITEVLMPNPYGNSKRNACYRKLREENIKVVTSDRGAFPNSWFFDQGFNYDSESYQPKSWNISLNQEQQKKSQDYIKQLITGDLALEKQGNRLGGEQLRKKLGLDISTKVIFVPLQRPDDTVIKFFSGFSQNIANFISQIEKISEELNSQSETNYVFLLKKHPLETDYFNFSDSNHIGYVSDDTNFYDLIELSDLVMLINSGVGLNALAYLKPVLAFGNAFYAHAGLAKSVESIDDAIEFIKKPIVPEKEQVEKFIYHLIEKVYSFGEFKTELVKQSDGSFRNITRSIYFENINWNGEKIKVHKKRVLVVSPLIPFPIYRGNQARIDAFVRWLINNDYSVDLFVLNTSFESMKSGDIKNQLMSCYQGINNVDVLKDPELEKKYQIKTLKGKVNKNSVVGLYGKIKTEKPKNLYQYIAKNYGIEQSIFKSIFLHELMNVKDKFLGNHHDVVNESKTPLKFINAVRKKLLSNSYDYVVLNYAKTIPCIPEGLSKTKVVLDTHDYQSMFLEEDQLFNNKNTNINLKRFRDNEHFLMGKADKLIAINKNEEEIFRKILPNKEIVTIPAFFPKPMKGPKFWGYSADALYVGSISNFNVGGIAWFLEEVLPLIKKQIPEFKLTIAGNVGKSKDVDWDKYGDNIKVVGRVDDLSYYYSNSCIVIAPILGGAGMKIKVVEALSYEKAIVGTPKAFDGITYPNTMDANVTDDPKSFADILIKLLNDSELRVKSEGDSKAIYDKEHSLKALNDSLLRLFG